MSISALLGFEPGLESGLESGFEPGLEPGLEPGFPSGGHMTSDCRPFFKPFGEGKQNIFEIGLKNME